MQYWCSYHPVCIWGILSMWGHGKIEDWPFFGIRGVLMKKIKWSLVFVVLCFFSGQGSGLAETMYVTDCLYLSLRDVPDLQEPSVAVLASDTKVDVLQTEGDWAEVTLEDGRRGWVMKKYLVTNLPKSLIIEELKGQIEDKNVILKKLREESASLKKEIEDLRNRIIHPTETPQMATETNIEELKGQIENKNLILKKLREENASLKKEISDLSILKTREAAMKKEIEDLRNRIIHQEETPQMATEKNTEELKGQIENKNLILKKLREENASLKKEISDLSILKTKEAVLKKEIEGLRKKIIHQNTSVEMATEKNIAELKGQIENKDLIVKNLRGENASLKKEIEDLKDKILHQSKTPEMATEEKSLLKRKEIYGIGIAAIVVGLIIGYLVRRPDKNRYYLR